MQQIKPCIWEAQGQASGKTITIIGGTHGNERTGVEVVLKLKSMIESGELFLKTGTVYLIHGNPRAIEISERGSEPFLDLNRSFPISLLMNEPTGVYEDTRAREIAPILQKSDIVVDLHATNKPSEPFVASMHSPYHEEVYQWFPCQKVLSDPGAVLAGEPVTTDEYTDAHGGIGLCYETGQASDLARVDEVTQNAINLLIDQGLVEGVVTPSICEHELYELTEPIILTQNGFTFAEGFGERSWELFTQGTTLGHHGPTPFVVGYDGVIVFPKVPEHRKVGKPLAYLAKRVK